MPVYCEVVRGPLAWLLVSGMATSRQCVDCFQMADQTDAMGSGVHYAVTAQG